VRILFPTNRGIIIHADEVRNSMPTSRHLTHIGSDSEWVKETHIGYDSQWVKETTYG
jgi:hypothetical protein